MGESGVTMEGLRNGQKDGWNLVYLCGGGCNNELPRRKDKEDDLAFARRCHQAAKTMIQGRHKRGLHL